MHTISRARERSLAACRSASLASPWSITWPGGGLVCTGHHHLGTMAVTIFDGKDGGGQYDGMHALITNTNTLAGALAPMDVYVMCTRVQFVAVAYLVQLCCCHSHRL
jgi:hypothetical protein